MPAAATSGSCSTRISVRPGRPVVDLPASVVANVVAALAAEYPEVLDTAWLLQDDDVLTIVYQREAPTATS